MKKFSQYLKSVRKQHSLTQTQFAARLGIDTAALSKIENEKKLFDKDKLETLSAEFDVDLSKIKSLYFGEKIAEELMQYSCPVDALEVAKDIFSQQTEGR